MKTCTKCGVEQALSEYTKDRSKRDGLRPICKACTYEKTRAYRAANTDAIREGQADYRKRNRAELNRKQMERQARKDPEERKRYMHRYYRENKESLSKYKRQYRIRNADRVRAYDRERQKNPERRRRHYLTQIVPRRAMGERKRIKPEAIEAMFEQYGNRCLACGATERLTMDHVIPFAKGGKHEIDNLQPLCHSCNSSKGAKTIDYRRALQ